MHLTARDVVEFVIVAGLLSVGLYFGQPALIATGDAHLADQICNALMFILPVVLVIAFGWRGVILGALAVWGLGYIAGEAINTLDPAHAELATRILDQLWVMGGWLAGLIYGLIIMGIRVAVLRMRPR